MIVSPESSLWFLYACTVSVLLQLQLDLNKFNFAVERLAC